MDAKCVRYSLLSVTYGYVLYIYLRFDLNGNSVSMCYWWQRIAYALCVHRDSDKPPGFHPKYLKLCSEDERSFYGFGTTWGLVINDKIFILGWSIPLTQHFLECSKSLSFNSYIVHSEQNSLFLFLFLYPLVKRMKTCRTWGSQPSRWTSNMAT